MRFSQLLFFVSVDQGKQIDMDRGCRYERTHSCRENFLPNRMHRFDRAVGWTRRCQPHLGTEPVCRASNWEKSVVSAATWPLSVQRTASQGRIKHQSFVFLPSSPVEENLVSRAPRSTGRATFRSRLCISISRPRTCPTRREQVSDYQLVAWRSDRRTMDSMTINSGALARQSRALP